MHMAATAYVSLYPTVNIQGYGLCTCFFIRYLLI